MTLFWFVGFTNRIKIISDKTFCFDVWPEPNLWTWHTSHIHRVGCNSEELCGISYVWIPTYVAQETRNDRFVILEPILPIASKRWVTHYPRVTKKKKQRCSYKLKQTNNGALTSLKWYIYIYIYIYICAVHLGFLPQTSLSCTCLPSPSLPSLVRLLSRVNLGL